eukprot:TRINITY_DN72260_c0_g1_i1.p1 TRINITY_DN72260_c0_g1~~TRINITY_DN72260_c0_g1_i1.p1  ORF type:complete len:443 (-),score=67.43 TRINITY_DN72260_c0_g1_i1:353-1636(-)
MARQLSNSDEFVLEKNRYGIGISWDESPEGNVDVDLQAVIIDEKGQVVDAVYYNNLKALKCVTHSGDETTGEKTGLDEMIWVSVDRIPAHIKMIVFVIAAFKGGYLRHAANGKVHVLEEKKENEVAVFSMERSEQNVDVVAMMMKTNAGWTLTVLDLDAREGQHFIDILEPVIGGLVRQHIPGAPKRLKVAFAMDKGTVVDLPQSSEVRQVTAGLGWDTSMGEVDLDVSAVLYDKNRKHRDTIFFGNLEGHGIKHSGDNLTGEGSGDDETIKVDLEHLPDWLDQIMFIVNIYTKGKSFGLVANPYCRILDQAGSELARYELREARDQSGLIIARLFREGSGLRWGFQAIGTFCRGQTWKDSLPDLAAICTKSPQQLQLRGMSSTSLIGGGTQDVPTATGRPVVAGEVVGRLAHPPQASGGSKACALL